MVWIFKKVVIILSGILAVSNGIEQQSFQKQKCLELRQFLLKNGLPLTNFQMRGDDQYNFLNDAWQLKPPAIFPLAFVLPRTEHEVMTLVAMTTKLSLPIVAKGGGHSFEKYSYGNSDTIVIDLRYLDQVEVDVTNQRATVGSGVLLGPLGWRLYNKSKVMVPTGYCPTIGIAGSTLGGGFGNFAAPYGPSLDNVLEMNVVNARGQLIVANNRTNRDLFWALRGAGDSFGIVTKFIFRTRPAQEFVFEGILNYDIRMFPQVAYVYQTFLEGLSTPTNVTAELEVETNATLRVRFTDVSGNDVKFELIRKIFPPTTDFTKEIYTFPDFLLFQAKVLSFEFLRNTTTLDKPSDLGNLHRSSSLPVYQYRKSYYAQKIVGYFHFVQMRTLLEQMPSTAAVWFEPLGGAPRAIGTGDTAFVHRGSTLYNVVATSKTLNPNNLIEIENGKTFVQKWFDLGFQIFQHTESYQNYADAELTNYLERYYGTNLARLVHLKKRYDPGNIFRHPQSIPTGFETNLVHRPASGYIG